MVCNTAENSIPNNFHTQVVMLYSFLALLKTKNRKPHNTSIHYRFNLKLAKTQVLVNTGLQLIHPLKLKSERIP